MQRIDSTELILIASAMDFDASVMTITATGTTTMPIRAGTG